MANQTLKSSLTVNNQKTLGSLTNNSTNQRVLGKLVAGSTIQIPGPSAYEIAVKNGFVGTEEEWLATLIGPIGPIGPKGDSGVYIGDNPPDDVLVWIDPTDDSIIYYGDYETVANKPTINNVELSGNLTLEDLGIDPDEPLTNMEIENLINSIT